MSELAINGGPKAVESLDRPDWPPLPDAARENVLDALENGPWCRNRSGGRWCDRFEAQFADYHDAKHAIAVNNGTIAIELALRACGVQPGDEVLVPSYSFIATASAIPYVGAIPRFVDVDPETYNLDSTSLEESITEDTVGVVGVHFAGSPMDMDEVLSICEENGLFLIEDAAHAQGSEWRGRKVGAIGDVGTFSFQESKSLSCGEGGMLVTDDDVLAERLLYSSNIGRARGQAGYQHEMVSTNSRLHEFIGALGVAQLENLDEQNRIRERNEEILVAELETIDGIRTKPRDERITARGYCLENFRYDADAFGGVGRDRFIEALRAEGLPVSRGYEQPLYRQAAFSRENLSTMLPPGTEVPIYRSLHLPGVEQVCRENVTFGHTTLLASEEDMYAFADAVRKVQDNAEELCE